MMIEINIFRLGLIKILFILLIGILPVRNADASLIGLTNNTLATLDPITGEVSTIGDPTGMNGYQSGSSAFNSNNKEYYVISSYWEEDWGWTPRIFTIDALTGSVVSDAILSDGFSGVQYENAKTPIPEPTTMLLFGVGLLAVAGVSRRRKKSAPHIA